MRIKFDTIENNTLKKYLEENHEFNNISDNLLESFNGSIEKAMNMRENKDLYLQLEDMILNINKISKASIINNSNIIYTLKEDASDTLDYINIILFKKLKESRSNQRLMEAYVKCIDSVNDAKVRLNGNSNFDMTIDNMLLNIWEELN